MVGMDQTWTYGAGRDVVLGLVGTRIGGDGREMGWGGLAGHGQAGTHLLALLLALSPQHLAVAELVLEQVLLGGGEEQPLGVQRPDDVVPDGAALPVVAAHSPRHVLSDHLWEYGGAQRDRAPLPGGHTTQSPPVMPTPGLGTPTSGASQAMMLSASMCLRTSRCCEGRAEQAGVRGSGDPPIPWDGVHPMGRSPLLGERGWAGVPRHAVPPQVKTGSLTAVWWGPPKKPGAPLTLRSIASDLGRSKQRAAREQKAQPCRRRPRLHLHSPLLGSSSPPPPCPPHPGVTSEPFQEEIVVLGGQGGQHVLQVLPKLWGEEGLLAEGSPLPPQKPQGWGFVPSLSSPPKKSQPGLRPSQERRRSLRPVPAPTCSHDEQLFSITGGILWDGAGRRIVTACPPAPVTPQRVTASPGRVQNGGDLGEPGHPRHAAPLTLASLRPKSPYQSGTSP